MTALFQAVGLTKTFTRPPGLVQRAGRALGLKPAMPPAVHAVNSVDLSIQPGEVLGLVGESGCGKSTFGRMAAGILNASAGEMLFDGRPIEHTGPNSIHRQAQMVFQNPYASLNPRQRVDRVLSEAALHHGLITASERRAHVEDLLAQVGLDAAYATRYPHQFSGGQRQRLVIARALAMQPKFMICDEAVSALDVSVQAQILNLFMDLRAARNLTYLFISHNLSVVEYLADRVAIMYLGRVVEVAPARTLFAAPNHPYTQALVADAPRMGATRAEHRPIRGELPSPLNPPTGCAFHPRCPHAMPRCSTEVPVLMRLDSGHRSACHLNDMGR